MIAAALLGVGAAPALGASGPATADGADGQSLTVSQSADLDPAGQDVTVTGSGYPTFKGIYLAVCKAPAAGERPTPCGGGIDTSGASQTSQWVSSNAPSYAKGLTVPYGEGGTFEVTLWAAPTLPDGQDCRTVKCAVVSRADHTRTSDRSQDVVIPITFAAEESDGAPVPVYVGGAVLGVVLIAALVAVGLRSRRRPTDIDDADDADDADESAATDGPDAPATEEQAP